MKKPVINEGIQKIREKGSNAYREGPHMLPSVSLMMAEGVLLLDAQERIVLANTAFAKQMVRSSTSLLGIKPSALGFTSPGSDRKPTYPWLQAIRHSETFSGEALQLRSGAGNVRSFVVTGAPVLDGWGKAKGAIATFDDVTALERKSDPAQLSVKVGFGSLDP